MSGHANFHTISGYTTLHLQAPPQLDGNVGVAGDQPVADDGGIGVGPEEEPRNVQTDVQAESSKALVRQLDILLARAAASATQSVDAKAVKAALNELGLPAEGARNARQPSHAGDDARGGQGAGRAVRPKARRHRGEPVGQTAFERGGGRHRARGRPASASSSPPVFGAWAAEDRSCCSGFPSRTCSRASSSARGRSPRTRNSRQRS